jgi:hypothetical protein
VALVAAVSKFSWRFRSVASDGVLAEPPGNASDAIPYDMTKSGSFVSIRVHSWFN